MKLKISIHELVALARAAFIAGSWSWDQMEAPEPPEPTDGQLMGIVVDNLGGVDGLTQAKDAGTRITAAAIPQEIAEVIEDLRSGALLSIGNELRGRDLSEAFSALVHDLLSEQLEEISDGGGVSP